MGGLSAFKRTACASWASGPYNPATLALTAGTRLGPYEIVAPLGAGGMGEVYKARDPRLERTVAIKILPEMLAADPQFRERFDREAKTISQLSHPHICTLFDVGDGYLVLELLDGETLADRLANHRCVVAPGSERRRSGQGRVHLQLLRLPSQDRAGDQVARPELTVL